MTVTSDRIAEKIKVQEAGRLEVVARGAMMRSAMALNANNTKANRDALMDAVAGLEADALKEHDRMERGGRTRGAKEEAKE